MSSAASTDRLAIKAKKAEVAALQAKIKELEVLLAAAVAEAKEKAQEPEALLAAEEEAAKDQEEPQGQPAATQVAPQEAASPTKVVQEVASNSSTRPAILRVRLTKEHASPVKGTSPGGAGPLRRGQEPELWQLHVKPRLQGAGQRPRDRPRDRLRQPGRRALHHVRRAGLRTRRGQGLGGRRLLKSGRWSGHADYMSTPHAPKPSKAPHMDCSFPWARPHPRVSTTSMLCMCVNLQRAPSVIGFL
ncbi:MAG: hypothetical protein J3K34DRAFT_400219 [Monoraphidium minutum]|nr:MAG: hypothetical protein J3K34DRAFT_400219 [Monoraphidium minutum]